MALFYKVLGLPRCIPVNKDNTAFTVTMSILRANTFPDDLFSSSRLVSLAAVEEALAQFEVAVQINFQRPGLLIGDLLQHQQHALPLVLACKFSCFLHHDPLHTSSLGINDDTLNPLRVHLHTLFQGEKGGKKVFADSIVLPLLMKLSTFLVLNELPRSVFQAQDIIKSNFRTVEAATVVLKLLSTINFAEKSPVSEDEEEAIPFRVRKQKRKKHARTKSQAIDYKPFETMDLQIPSTKAEAERVQVDILNILSNILEVCSINFDYSIIL